MQSPAPAQLDSGVTKRDPGKVRMLSVRPTTPDPEGATVAESSEQTDLTSSPQAPDENAVSIDVAVADELAERKPKAGVRLRAQGGVVRRSLEFSQDVYDRLRTLNTNLYVYRVDAAVYPSFRSIPLGGQIGLIASFESAFAGSVRDADFGASYEASHSELFGGLRLRRPVRGHELGFDVTFGRLESGLNDGAGAAGTPDASYSEARSSLDLTVYLGRVRATGAVGFRVPFGYGELADAEWFPRVGGYGVEASMGASYLLSKGILLDVSASLRRYVLEMNSEPEDAGDGIAEVAGGAVDSFLGGYVGMSFTL